MTEPTTTANTDPDAGFLTQPDVIIAAIISDIEPQLERAAVAAAITHSVPTRAQRRRLVHALTSDPTLLTSGRPEGPPRIERLIRALQALGARGLVLPRCGHCHRPRQLTARDRKLRIRGLCDTRRRAAAEPCVECGASRQIASRDRHGQPLCGRCSS
ncbi:MAG: hypothetical protein ACRDS9_05465 [Pseudonocardiaceae bacterium]